MFTAEKTHRIGTERSVRVGGGDWNAVISHSVTVTLSVTHCHTLSVTQCYTLSVGKKWEPGKLVPSRFSGQIRKVEARLGKLAKIRKVETN